MDLEVFGGLPLRGEIRISGAKNAAMKMVAAACLSEEEIELKEVPEILDVKAVLEIFQKIGGQVKKYKPGHYKLSGEKIKNGNLNFDIVSKLRGAVVFIGPLLARFKEVILPMPGGCHIGARPIDTHIKLFENLGAEVKEKKGIYYFELSRIKNRNVVLDEMSVTATENAILFASFFQKPIKLRAIAIEPEIIDLMDLLEKMGVKIEGKGSPFIKVYKKNSKFQKAHHSVVPDRIETGTWAILAAVSKGGITLRNTAPETLDMFFNKLSQTGAKVEIKGDKISVSAKGYFKPINLDTRTYPGFPTDLQAPFSIVMTQAKGTSHIFETLFEDRLQYLKELRKMGANTKILNSHSAVIQGPTVLYGKTIHSLDLRAGVTLILAALVAKGKSLIEDVGLVDRGYENWEEKLKSLGAKINRVL